jgi:hypothetical protein
MGFVALGVVFFGTMFGCAPGLNVPAADLGLAKSLEGVWLMQSELSTDCPPEAGMPSLQGQTEWVRQGAKITIGALDRSWETTPMLATVEGTLVHFSEHKKLGCTMTVLVEMSVDSIDEDGGFGCYQARIYGDGGTSCGAAAAHFGLPEECQVSGDWAIRG